MGRGLDESVPIFWNCEDGTGRAESGRAGEGRGGRLTIIERRRLGFWANSLGTGVMPGETRYRRSCGFKTIAVLHWAGLVLAMAGGPVAAQVQGDLAPIHRRFEVHRTEGGYELLGFRASVGRENRFVLAAGIPAARAREQMLSVGWEESYGLLDPTGRALWGRRVRFSDVVETVAVVLDPSDGYVRTVVYERQPALYSRAGLLRYLEAAFREGRVLVSSEDRVSMEYPLRGGQVLRVEATRLGEQKARWRIVYRMDVAGPARTTGE